MALALKSTAPKKSFSVATNAAQLKKDGWNRFRFRSVENFPSHPSGLYTLPKSNNASHRWIIEGKTTWACGSSIAGKAAAAAAADLPAKEASAGLANKEFAIAFISADARAFAMRAFPDGVESPERFSSYDPVFIIQQLYFFLQQIFPITVFRNPVKLPSLQMQSCNIRHKQYSTWKRQLLEGNRLIIQSKTKTPKVWINKRNVRRTHQQNFFLTNISSRVRRKKKKFDAWNYYHVEEEFYSNGI